MRILGIDPGYGRLGLAIIERKNGQETVLYSDCLEPEKKLPFADKLLFLGNQLETLITTWQPTIIAIEKLFFTKNQKTASQVSETRGLLIYLGAKHQLKIFEYTPMEIKLTITGYGQATKNQVLAMVKLLTKLNKPKALDDEIDAIAISLTCFAKENLT